MAYTRHLPNTPRTQDQFLHKQQVVLVAALGAWGEHSKKLKAASQRKKKKISLCTVTSHTGGTDLNQPDLN